MIRRRGDDAVQPTTRQCEGVSRYYKLRLTCLCLRLTYAKMAASFTVTLVCSVAMFVVSQAAMAGINEFHAAASGQVRRPHNFKVLVGRRTRASSEARKRRYDIELSHDRLEGVEVPRGLGNVGGSGTFRVPRTFIPDTL